MESVSHPDPGGIASCDHVVEWQLTGTPPTARGGAGDHDVRERIGALQAQAMALLHAVVTSRGTAAARQALSAVDSEIAGLRAELAWRRAEARDHERPITATAADA